MSDCIITRRGGSSAKLQEKSVSINLETTDIYPDEGYKGISKLTVTPTANLQEITASASTTDTVLTPSSGYDGFSKVTISKIEVYDGSVT